MNESTETTQEVQLQALRLLCLLATVLPVLFGIFYQLEVPAAVDPLWGRILVSTVPLTLFVASYVSHRARRHLLVLLRYVIYGLLVWFVGLTIANGFATNYAIGLLFTFVALGIGVSVGVDSAAPIARFLGFGTVLVSSAVLGSGSVPVGSGIFVTSTASLALVLYVAVRTHLHTQQALRASEARFRAIFEGAGPGIAILDAERRLRDVNPAMERILNRDGTTLENANLDDLLHPDDVADDRSRFAQLVAGNEEHYQAEYRFLAPDDAVVWGQFSVSPLPTDLDAEAPRLAAFLVDVTDRKQLEGQIQQAQKMETVGTLAGGIAHDFNNILHSAKVYLQMTLEDLSSESSLQEYLVQVNQGLERAEELVKKLLTFSRQEGRTAKKRFDLTEVAQETLDLVEPSLPNDVTLRTHLSEDALIEGDPGQLHQVMTNLLTNAGEAMAENPDDANVLEIDLRTTNVGPDLARQYLNLEPGRYVRLTVSDTGPGMDAETQENIFEPFFTTKGDEGTGLGLSVVHGIVRAHDGEIIVFSEPGEGTTFSVYVPALDASGAPASGQPRESGPSFSASGHVLLVDDDADQLSLETDRLQRLGYRVTSRQRGEEALDVLTQATSPPSLLLVDYDMPGMNGLELTRAVKQRHSDLPVVLLSGYSAQLSKDEVRDAGVDRFLRKPVTTQELDRILDALVSPDG